MTFHRVISSNLIEQREAQKRILDAVESFHWPANDMFGIKLALEEVLINAIKHGNKFDKSKKVKIDATVTYDRIEITVEDEGEGFCKDHVPDPTAEENLTKCSGRGILLMEAYMDEISYSKGGRRCRIIKARKDHSTDGTAHS